MPRLQEVDAIGAQFYLNGQYANAINALLLFWQPVTMAQIGANQNNYNVGEFRVARLSSDASRNITGFANGENGIVLHVINVGAQDIVIQDQHVDSSEANRVITLSGADVTLGPDAVMLLWYDPVTLRWRQIV